MSNFCENCKPHRVTPHIIPPLLVNVWLIFNLQRHVNTSNGIKISTFLKKIAG